MVLFPGTFPLVSDTWAGRSRGCRKAAASRILDKPFVYDILLRLMEKPQVLVGLMAGLFKLALT